MQAAVVIPVRNAARMLDDCLHGVMPQAQGADADVVVVDDASTDDTAEVAEAAGAHVLRLTAPGGPYRARNLGWQSTQATHVVFTDVRSRPHPGWLTAIVAALDAPGAAIAGGDALALPGDAPAVRYVHKWQPLRADRGMEHEFLPFLPTCNLATHRSVLEAVDGFRALRSGGDLDFCWRVQLAGLGSVRYVPEAAVDWVPRETVREVVRQWYRYGAAKPLLFNEYAAHGLEAPPPPSRPRLYYRETRQLLHELRTKPRSEWPIEIVDRLCMLAWWTGYRREWQKVHIDQNSP